MTIEQPEVEPDGNALLAWQVAVAVLAVLTLTLLLINLGLRGRADDAVAQRDEAVASAEQAKADAATLQRRNDELLSQLSTSSERLSGIIETMALTDQELSAADANVDRQVAAQNRAKGNAKVQAQLRNAQTCAAGTVLALSQIHAGPDIESGSNDAAVTLEAVAPACQAGLE